MRHIPRHSASSDQVSPALRGRAPLRAGLAAAFAAAIAFVPAIVISSPAHATPGDLTISSDLEVAEDDVLTFDLTWEGDGSPEVLTYTVGGTATSPAAATTADPADYQTFTGGTTTFTNTAGLSVKRFTIRGVADTRDENNETVVVSFFQGGVLAKTFTGTFADDDATPTYSLSTDTSIGEEEGLAVITATLTAASGLDVTIPVTTTAGSALATQDYTALTNQPIVIPKGALTGSVNVTIADDDLDEADTQSFTVAKGSNSLVNVGIGSTPTATVTINDDEALPTVTIADPGQAVEGSPLTFVAGLSGQSERTVTVEVDSADGSAEAGEDYTAVANHTVSFAPLDTSEDIPVTTATDLLDEVHPETLTLTMSNPNHAVIDADDSALGGINDDDTAPTITLSPSTVTEGESDSNAEFTVTLDNPSGQTVLVDYSTSSGTATEDEDFEEVEAQLEFAPGEQVKTFEVPVKGDTTDEGASEDFNITLSNPGATLSSSPSLGTNLITLTDDDATPTLDVFNDITRDEGTGAATFELSLSNPSAEPITLDVSVADGTAEVDGSGAGSNDFDAPNSTVTFLPGQTEKSIPVHINADTVFEDDEEALVSVSIPFAETDVTGPGATATLRLDNDDDAPTVTLTSESSAEGTYLAVSGVVTGSTESAIPLELALAGASVAGSDAAESADFVGAGVLSNDIPAGHHDGAVVLLREFRLNNDTFDEAVETVVATMTDPAGNVPTASNVQRINDDPSDLPPSVAVGDATISESGGSVNVPVSLTFAGETTKTERPVVVHYTTEEGTAKSGTDYTGGTSSISIASGTTSGMINIPVAGNLMDQDDRAFAVKITSVTPAEATITDAEATVTITDDDADIAKPTFSVADATKVENSTGPATVTINLGAPTSRDITFAVAVTDGTAVDAGTGAGSNDYNAPASATVTVPAGQPSATFAVPVNADAVFEDDETVQLSVSLAPGETDAIGAADTATLTITDDDEAPSIALNTQSGTEGSDLTVIATVTGTAQAATTFDLTLTGDDSGQNDPAEASDFDDTGLQAVIPGGTASGAKVPLRTIRLEQDTIDEWTEFIHVHAEDVAGHVDDAYSVYRINDDAADLPPSVALTAETIGESLGSVDVGVELSFEGETTATERDTVLKYRTQDGSARAGYDYTGNTNGTLTIAAGNTEGEINVPILNDEVDEVNQDFFVEVTSVVPTDTKVTTDKVAVMIYDNDNPATPTISAPANRLGAGPVTITGTAGQGTKVQLLATPVGGGEPSVVAETYANPVGQYTFTRTISVGYQVAVVSGSLTSAVKTIWVRHDPSLSADSTRRGTATLRVTGDPKLANLTVVLQRANANGTWSTVGTGRTNSAGAYTRTITGLRSGSRYTFRAGIVGNENKGLLSGYSAGRRVTVD